MEKACTERQAKRRERKEPRRRYARIEAFSRCSTAARSPRQSRAATATATP
jgi:hypothetical protein